MVRAPLDVGSQVRNDSGRTSLGGAAKRCVEEVPWPGKARSSPAVANEGGTVTKQIRQLDRVVIRFAGDSGDGMQLTGDRFTSETAQLGNDISTLPNFPAEIRAPAGTLPGVSSFQVHFADYDILTPGDAPNVLVAMNPAALKANLADLPRGADIIVNTDEFTKRNLAKVGYPTNPLDDDSLGRVRRAPGGADLDDGRRARRARRCPRRTPSGRRTCSRSACSPGCTPGPTSRRCASWSASSPARPELVAANIAAFRAGWNFGETTEDFAVRYEVKPAKMPPGTYRNITGNAALSLGLVAAGVRSGLPVFLGAYPITPGLGHPARAEQAQALRRAHHAGRGRDRRGRRRAGRVVRRLARRDHHQRPRRGAQERDDLARGGAGAAAGDRGRAARRPVDRHADQDRAGRPQHGAATAGTARRRSR